MWELNAQWVFGANLEAWERGRGGFGGVEI
jgi:hypothetical protein